MPDPRPLPELWTNVQDQLRRAVGESTYALWLAPLELRGREGDVLLLTAPDEIRSWVSDRFARVLQSCVAAELGPEVTTSIVPATEAPPAPRAARTPSWSKPEPMPTLNPKYGFEQFVIGDTNRMAHAAALAIAEMPGQAYNPLFIYGAPGLGKTHLLHAIGNYVTAHDASLSVRYATVESFTNHFVHSLQSGSTDQFKASYRASDVLLIDDIQFLQSKARTEEEFFHTFNALYESGSQLVLTSDRPPRDLAALEDRLRERFESGLVTDIHPPDMATRLAILRKRVQHDRITLADPQALEVIAERITANVRALEGALVRVVAYHSLTRRSIDATLAREVLDTLYPAARRPPSRSVHEVQSATCEAFSISLEELLSASRSQRLAWPRQVAMYLARELTDQTLPAIGREFGGRNHTTVIHACKRTAERIGADREAYSIVNSITQRLQEPHGDRPD
ncbi:MAG: chromosomal replication initiator protein DnaA [Solirubrobacteraceae bacterium]